MSQVMGREGFGEHPINPISPPTIMFDDLIDDHSHLSLLTLLSSLIVSQVSLSGCGRLLVGPSQKGMQNCHDLRPLADSRGDALDGIRPDIPDGEDTPAAGL